MIYIKPNDSEEVYIASVMPFKTQHGYNAVRVIGNDIPLMENGFKLFSDNVQIGDYSDYIYQYRENEYSVEHDEIIEPIGSDAPLSPSEIEILNNKINTSFNILNKKIIAITPYTDNEIGYYGETEKNFYNVPVGNVSVFFDNYNGDYIVKRINDIVTISFDSLLDTTNITIMVQ